MNYRDVHVTRINSMLWPIIKGPLRNGLQNWPQDGKNFMLTCQCFDILPNVLMSLNNSDAFDVQNAVAVVLLEEVYFKSSENVSLRVPQKDKIKNDLPRVKTVNFTHK